MMNESIEPVKFHVGGTINILGHEHEILATNESHPDYKPTKGCAYVYAGGLAEMTFAVANEDYTGPISGWRITAPGGVAILRWGDNDPDQPLPLDEAVKLTDYDGYVCHLEYTGTRVVIAINGNTFDFDPTHLTHLKRVVATLEAIEKEGQA